MELLYVWIEKYKNIEKQGFNFSPKYRFSFDEESKTVNRDENRSDKVINDFFGEKISNITAIVGENGSGKSNLCEFLLQQYGEYRLLKEVDTMCSFLIFGDNGVFYKYEDKIQVESKNFLLEAIYTLNCNCIHYSLHINKEEMAVGIKNSISNYANLWSSPFSENKISIHDYHKEDTLTILKFLIFINRRFELGTIKEFSYPSKMYIDIKKRVKEILNSNFGEQKNWENNVKVAYSFFTKCDKLEAVLIFTKISQENFQDNLIAIEEKARAILERNTRIGFEELKELCEDFDFLKTDLEGIKKDLEYFKFVENKAEISLSDDKLDYDFSDKFKIFYDKYSALINIEWEYSLATGFNNLLSFMSRCNIKAREHVNKNLPLILIIDEGETALHPNLQRKYLGILIEFLNHDFVFELKKGLKIQIILATHSPFILSDLPKENVIFLKNKDGKCEVQNGSVDIKQTFGANIHTLLSDSFFMDGLVGKFSSDKINEVIKYLNGETVEEMNGEKAEKIINMIGEPIIKRYLTQQLNLKKQNITFDKVKELENRIAELEKNQKDDKN